MVRSELAEPEAAGRQWLPDWLIAILLGGGVFALYVLTLAPTVLGGDGGEFQFVPYLLGVAHPTGYPLYILLGWLWSHLLPIGDVAYRMNLFSAFWSALAVALLYPTARVLLRQAFSDLSPLVRRLLAVLATVTFAVTPTLWSQAIIAEVYGLHIFFVVLLFYLTLTWGERRDFRFLLFAACCFGLSMAHHSTTILLALAILAYIWLSQAERSTRYRDRLRPATWLLLPTACCLPLLLYLYIPLRAPHTPYLRQPLTPDRELVLYENTIASFFDFVTGGPFGGSVDFSVDLGERLAMAWGFFRGEVTWIGVLLAVVGVTRLVFSRCWALLALTGLAFVATVGFNLFYTIGDIYVLYVPSYLVVVLWMVVGVGALLGIKELGNTVPVRRWEIGELGRVVFVLILFVLPVWMLLSRYTDLDQSGNTRARKRWEAILAEPLPADAVLVSDDRNNIMPMWYFQYVDGMRPDLLGLFPLITPDYPTLGPVLDLALSTGRPVYLIKEMVGIEVKVQVEPEGALWRILGLAAVDEPAHSLDAQLGDAVALVGYDHTPHSPRPGDTLQVSLYWEALRPLEVEYHSFVHMLDAAGQIVAQSDGQPGGLYYPTTIWQPSERLRDEHLLSVPGDTLPGVYRLVGGMYAFADDGSLVPLGDPVEIGKVGVKTEVQTESGDIGHPLEADFDGQIELLGYNAALREGTMALTLHWRCLRPPDADYSVFVHLLDAAGETIAQHDGPPQGGAYPFSVCDAGEIIVDERKLALPEGLPSGAHRLRVGLYLLESGTRLPVVDGGDSVEFELDEGN